MAKSLVDTLVKITSESKSSTFFSSPFNKDFAMLTALKSGPSFTMSLKHSVILELKHSNISLFGIFTR